MVQIRAPPNIKMMEISFIILFTKVYLSKLCLSVVYMFVRGFVALWL